MNELDLVLKRFDELSRTPGRDVEAVTIDRAHLLEDGLRLLTPKIIELENRLARLEADW